MKKLSIVLGVLFLASFCVQAQETSSAVSKEILALPTGKYSVDDTVVTISLNGENGLSATLANGTGYELIPAKGTTFTVKGMNGTVPFLYSGTQIPFRKNTPLCWHCSTIKVMN